MTGAGSPAEPPGAVAGQPSPGQPADLAWRKLGAEPGLCGACRHAKLNETRRGTAYRVDVLRDAARAEAAAGREMACVYLKEALRLMTDRRARAEIALEVAKAYAALFRWVDAVDVIEQALAELDGADQELAARLEAN